MDCSHPLLAAAPPSTRSQLLGDAELERWLKERWAAALLAWPKLALEPAAFFAHLGARLSGDGDAWQALRSLRSDDLYLACACQAGDERALQLFEAAVLPAAIASLAHLRLGAAQLDELKQRLRRLLFTSDGSTPPRIAAYAGRGDLVAFVRVVATRLGLKLLRAERATVPLTDEPRGLAAAAHGDAEMRHLKRHYRPLFRVAFTEALALLRAEQRLLLRQYYSDGETIERIAERARTHRVTISRRLEATRLELRDHIRRRMMARIQVSQPECDSIARLVQSQFDLTFDGALGRY